MRGLGTPTALALPILLSACAGSIPGTGPIPPTDEGAKTALAAGVRAGPDISRLGIGAADATAALASFVESCPKLIIRTDASGLTGKADWQPACSAAGAWQSGDALNFFKRHFETVLVGTGEAFSTGYFEPQIGGSRDRRPGYDTPVYSMPADLVRAKEGDAEQLSSGRMPLGRYDGQGRFVPYYTRGQIEDGALEGRGLEIAWAADPVEFFFLQVQGSGRLRGPDGTVMRIGYAGQSGRAYTGIGGLMRKRGLLGDGPGQYPGSMQGIMQYLREKPEAGRALMRENQSWVFFRELTGDGPIGALGVPVRRESSVAADPKFVPLGAPVWLDLDRGEADGLWIAQDTGGAIKGANRFDTFWGAGDDARLIAGGMQGKGKALLMLPKGTLKRLGGK
ncbi:MAG: murein transglycosylase A [Novosphingobium sp.]|nr:murein transglycosylase A [Novosphingobium sp.]